MTRWAGVWGTGTRVFASSSSSSASSLEVWVVEVGLAGWRSVQLMWFLQGMRGRGDEGGGDEERRDGGGVSVSGSDTGLRARWVMGVVGVVGVKVMRGVVGVDVEAMVGVLMLVLVWERLLWVAVVGMRCPVVLLLGCWFGVMIIDLLG